MFTTKISTLAHNLQNFSDLSFIGRENSNDNTFAWLWTSERSFSKWFDKRKWTQLEDDNENESIVQINANTSERQGKRTEIKENTSIELTNAKRCTL